ncbi:phosphatase PAP2 family protein [Metabacillus indicus]|uniref:phosphatase PAP2 family protein n=1 Tax=Metabacillus indicus TaxID=246786 RepID=UPI00398458F2
MTKNYILKIRDLSGFLVFPLLGLMYEFLNERQTNAVDMTAQADAYIPFVPVFILPYIIWYVYMFGFLLYFWWRDSHIYWKTVIALTAGELICFGVYFFFQSTVPRPELTGDGFLIHLVSVIYQNDQPFNCFPSIHVLTTFIIMLVLPKLKLSRMVSFLSQLTGILIILSTLFVKQHVIYDVIASIALGLSLWYVLFELKRAPARLPSVIKEGVSERNAG